MVQTLSTATTMMPIQPPPQTFLVSEKDLADVKETLLAYTKQESMFYLCHDYLAAPGLELDDGECDGALPEVPSLLLPSATQLDAGSRQVQEQQAGPIPNPLMFVAECASIVADCSVRDELLVPNKTALLPRSAPLTPTTPWMKSTTASPIGVASPARNHHRNNTGSSASDIIKGLFAPTSPAHRRHNDEAHESPRCIADPLFATVVRTSGLSTSQFWSKFDQYRSYLSHVAFWRQQMYTWATSVLTRFQIPHPVLAPAFRILDRFIAKELPTFEQSLRKCESLTRDDFQLYAMVALYISCKCVLSRKRLSVEVLCEMSRDYYSPEDIEQTEREMLLVLGWRVNPITPMDYCRLYLSIMLPCDRSSITRARLEETCQIISDAAIADPSLLSVPASSIALTTVLLAATRDGMPVTCSQAFMDRLHALTEDSPLLSSMIMDDFPSVFRRVEKQIPAF